MLETLQQWLRRIGLGGGAVLGLLYVGFCAYSLPQTSIVKITGTEVLRKDVQQRNGTNRTNDVKYVTAEDLDGTPRFFRNVDTGIGWPPYLKFNSGDVLAQANGLSRAEPRVPVLVRYYGFRIRMLSMAPNLLSIRVVPANHSRFPIFVTAFIVLHVIGIGFVLYRIRRWRNAQPEDQPDASVPS